MPEAKDRLVSTLNDLIETCRDGEHGFRTAAEALDNAPLRAAFLRLAEERQGFAATLQAEVRRLGAQPETEGSTAGALHRGWINLKSAVTGRDEHAIVAAAETGEDSAKRAYEDALAQAGLPADVRALIERQAAAVRQAHDYVRSLRDRTRAA
jgi:uncharacterized protein (TIGR02284 family)